jgi:Ca2+-binding RTX toxin-like protein
MLGLLLAACGDSCDNGAATPTVAPALAAPAPVTSTPILAVENNTKSNALLALNPGGPGGSPNQSLRAGDVLMGDEANNILVGGLGVDLLVGAAGDDVFVWAPGDGSDYFDGGEGIDVLVFGVVGESRDSTAATDGAPFFGVNPPGTDGTMDDDGLRIALSVDDVEFVVCTKRDFVADAGVENIEVFDISGEVSVVSDLTELSAYVQNLII